MPIRRSDVEDELERGGFERTGATDRTVEYKSKSNGKFIYFRTSIGLTEHIRLVVPPDCDWPSLLAVPGVAANPLKELQHGDHMKEFPKRKNKGKNEVHYGKPLNLASIAALPAFAAAFHRL